MPTVDRYKALLSEKPAVKKCLAYMYQELLGFQEKLLEFFSKAGKTTFHTDWKDYQEPFSNVLKGFDIHRRILEDLLRDYDHQSANARTQNFNNYLLQYQDDRHDIQRYFDRYEQDIETLRHNAKAQEEDRKEKQFDAVRNWLAAPMGLQTELHNGFRETRDKYPGTTEWILDLMKIQNWICTPIPEQSILWINGKKGAGQFTSWSSLTFITIRKPKLMWSIGKSTLASQIIDHCIQSQGRFKTSYFYCRQNNSYQDNCLTIYKSLLSQMLIHFPELLPTCNEKRLKGNYDILSDNRVAELLIELFCDMKNTSQFIVIDGLDEIDPKERKTLVQFLARTVDRCDTHDPGKIRVLFVSHDLVDIRKIQRIETATVLDLNPDDTQQAIRKFVDKNIDRLRERGLEDDEAQWAQKLIISRSNGGFSYGVYQIIVLRY